MSLSLRLLLLSIHSHGFPANVARIFPGILIGAVTLPGHKIHDPAILVFLLGLDLADNVHTMSVEVVKT